MKNKMRASTFLLVFISHLIFFVQVALATHPVTVFGPKTFTRTTGAPNTFQEKFSLPTLLGKFTLTVNSNKVSSATIKLNGTEIFSPNSFNENVTFLTKEVAPKLGQNIFDIQIAGKPNSSLKLTLTFLSPIKVTVTPEKADVTVKEIQQFKATVLGTEDQRVTWQIVEKESGKGISRLGAAGLGTIDDTGLYTAPELAPMPPFVTIQAQSVANPFETAKATIIVRDVRNFAEVNADGDLDAVNYGKFIGFSWVRLPSGTTKVILYRSLTKDGPWEEVVIDEYAIDMTSRGNIGHDDTDIVPVDTANDYFYKIEAFSPTGQVLKSYAPVFVRKYVIEKKSPEEQNSFLNSPLSYIQLASTSFSGLFAASSPPACESPSDEFITNKEFRNKDAMTLQKIRDFLKEKGSFLQGDEKGFITDTNGEKINPASEILIVSTEETINPQVLLTMLQKEGGAIVYKEPPDTEVMEIIMGCGKARNNETGEPPQFPTIRQQIRCAAQSLDNRFKELDDIKINKGNTRTDLIWNLTKTTRSKDGVDVKPANAATGALFAYNPVVGIGWKGKTEQFGGNFLFCNIWHNMFKFTTPCPSEPAQLTLTGSDVAKVNEVYTAAGGTEPYTYSISGGSINPATGQITSLPACASGQPAKVTITATDSCGKTGTKDVRMPNGAWVMTKMIIPNCNSVNRIYQGNVYYHDGQAVPACDIISGTTRTIQAFYHYTFQELCGSNPYCISLCAAQPDCCKKPGEGALCSVPYGSYMLYEYHYEWRCQ